MLLITIVHIHYHRRNNHSLSAVGARDHRHDLRMRCGTSSELRPAENWIDYLEDMSTPTMTDCSQRLIGATWHADRTFRARQSGESLSQAAARSAQSLPLHLKIYTTRYSIHTGPHAAFQAIFLHYFTTRPSQSFPGFTLAKQST